MTQGSYLNVENLIEGVNRARGESAETIHHLFMARLKGYITEKMYMEFRDRYKECIRMLNGLEKTLERKVPEKERRWHLAEDVVAFNSNKEPSHQGWPAIANQIPVEDHVAGGASFLLTPET